MMKMAPLARAVAADFSIQPLAFSLSCLCPYVPESVVLCPRQPLAFSLSLVVPLAFSLSLVVP
jgi:hypothetical protein